MRCVFTHEQGALVGHVCAVLRSNGIRCEVRNEFVGGAAGELPVFDCWPEVWVMDHAAAQALDLIAALRSQAEGAAAPDWRCRGCGERVDGQFGRCWNCGEGAP